MDLLRVWKQLREVKSCIEDTMVCEEKVVPQLVHRSHSTQVKMLHEDAGTHFQSTVGVSQDFVAMKDAELSEEFFSEWRTFDTMNARVKVAVAALGRQRHIRGCGFIGRA